MQPHIARTIEDIELKIGFLQRLAEALRNFDSVTAVGAPVPVANPGLPLISNGKNGHAGGRRGSTLNVTACKPSKRQAESLRLAGIVGKMTEPFNAALIASRANIDSKSAGNFITYHLKKGWLVRAGRGEYKRTEIFGGGRQSWRENVSGNPCRN